MSFQFRPATRESAKLLIGLCGPSGSGKTLSALKLATGMGGTIAYIDTEGGRACQYADDYKFLHATLEPLFHPDRYRAIVDAAVKTNPGVIIIDSASHVWEGPGGILDMVDQAKKNSGGGNDFGIWAAPKQAHQKLVNRLIQLPAHVILCFRAKEKRGLVPDGRRPGKMEVVNLGWHPIAENGVVYELTINCLLSTDKKGAPVVDGFDFGKLPYNMAHLLPSAEQISEETGKRFAEWTKGGEKPSADNKAQTETLDDTITDDNDHFAHLGGGADEPLPHAFKSGREILNAIDGAADLTELAQIDNAMHQVITKLSESAQTKLMDAMRQRKDALMREAA